MPVGQVVALGSWSTSPPSPWLSKLRRYVEGFLHNPRAPQGRVCQKVNAREKRSVTICHFLGSIWPPNVKSIL